MPEESVESTVLLLATLNCREDNGSATYSSIALGLFMRIPRVSWACTAAVACLRSEAERMLLCSITSDMLLFLRIGFFCRLTSESVLDSVVLEGSVVLA